MGKKERWVRGEKKRRDVERQTDSGWLEQIESENSEKKCVSERYNTEAHNVMAGYAYVPITV